ncbi:MAG: ATP-binding protein [Gemmatimonadaceae bacterium]
MPAFVRDSPWWKAATAIAADPDLLRMAAASVRFEHPLPFALDRDAVYTLRGPRQVGKSTLLKRVVRLLLEQHGVSPRCILYADLEGAGLTTVVRLRNALTGYVAWARSAAPGARLYLLLDEVTGVKDWGTAIRTLYREGSLTNATVIATGSHALDLARGGETAPGRRGERAVDTVDWVMMPLSFRDYVAAHDAPLAAVLPAVDVFDPRSAAQAAQEIALHDVELGALFTRYLMTGGYPHAMAEEHAAGRLGRGVYDIYRAAITGQMKRAGHREGLFREIVSWATDHRLGQEFSWNTVSGETDVGSKDTARRYVEDAEGLFLWHILYRAQEADSPTPALRSPKKLYPADPFSWHVLASWASGGADPWAASVERLQNPTILGHLVEAVAADHFIRALGRFALYHRTDRGDEEIDLVLHRARARARLEIKYRPGHDAKYSRHLAKYGGGILAGPEEVRFDAGTNVTYMPLYAVLAGLTAPLSLFPSPGF